MPASRALLALLTGSFLGLTAGLVSGSAGSTGSSPLTRAARWTGEWVGLSGALDRTAELESRLRDLQERSADLETLQTQLSSLETGDWSGSAHEYMEAKRLGIMAAVAANQPELHASAVRRMGMAIVSEAQRNSLDPLLLTALAHAESRFNPFATSYSGARGLFQLRAPTGRTMATANGSTLRAPMELYDIETNVALGATYLAQLVRQFPTVDAALLAYNRGVGGAKAALRSEEGRRALQGYPKDVLTYRDRLAERAQKHRDLPL